APVDSPVLSKDTLKGHLEPLPVQAVAAQPVTGKQTMKGHIEGPLPPLPTQPPAPVEAPLPPLATQSPAPALEPRRRTGTPQVGVPMPYVQAPVPEAPAQPQVREGHNQAPITGVIEQRVHVEEPPREEPARVKAPTGPIDAAPSGRSRTGSAGPSDSAAWFEDGERASEEADKIRRRKL